MITQQVTQEQLAAWQALYRKKRPQLRPNRITGAALDRYFREHYAPEEADLPEFRGTVRMNALESEHSAGTPEDIRVYRLAGGVYVGIDTASGFFHVECEEMALAVPVWDDLFTARGLSASDLDNYVLTAQYLLLTGEGQ